MGKLSWRIVIWLGWFTPLFVVEGQVPGGGVGGMPSARTFESRNGKFRLVLEPDPGSVSHLKGSIVKRHGLSQSAQWTTAVPYVGPLIRLAEAFVSDHGDFFLTITSRPGDIGLYRKEGAAVLIHRALFFGQQFASLADRMPGVDIIDGEQVIRLWDREYNEWSAFKTSNGSALRASADDIARWNEATRQEIVEKLYAVKREELRRKAAEISAPLARLAGASRNVTARETDYEFLATLRNPEDRKWIEEMVELGEAGVRFGMFRFAQPQSEYRDPYHFAKTDYARARGDWLLGFWDQKVAWEKKPRSWEDVSQMERFHGGKVYGTVRLPMPMPIYRNSTQTTVVHVRLLSADGGARKDQEERISGAIGFERARNRRVVYDMTFGFTTVRAGTYQVKAVWDKRQPFTNTNSAGPGDYETALSAPFVVSAGKTLSHLLFCTNRVTGGESYYAADEALAAKWVADNPAAPPEQSSASNSEVD